MRRTVIELLEQKLARIDEETANAYEMALPLMVETVNAEMQKLENLADVIGPNLIEVMFTDHMNHANFILSQLRMKSAKTMVEVITWVYRSYVKRGFSPSYFPVDIRAWKRAIAQYIPEPYASQLQELYQVFLDSHQEFLVASQRPEEAMGVDDAIYPYFQEYLAALLEPNSLGAIQLARSYIRGPEHIPIWWEQVIWPAMHEIGRLWSEGIITVGQEHIATSITQRIMSIYYPMILELPRKKGTVLVAASSGELHEIGARMVADFLELHGWDVYYTGADTPQESIVDLLHHLQCRFLCISTTMPYNLRYVSRIVERVRDERFQGAVKVIVGGQAYRTDPGVWQKVGADHYVASASEVVRLLEAFLTDSSGHQLGMHNR